MMLNPHAKTQQRRLLVASMAAALSLTATAPMRAAKPKTGGQLERVPT